ncbi:MAG: TIGR04282 family arsenosugar biosynthesis glycosyltransferase, partial [Planctomycetota bacterium]
MAKAAVPGRVKTRLTRGPDADRLTPEQAAGVHAAMLDTVLQRLADHVTGPDGGPPALVLAMDDPAGAPPAPGWTVVEQGPGDLGQRLERVWRDCRARNGTEAAVFFGVDSPDVPAEVLRQIGPALNHTRAAVGPVEDGGYWTLACGLFAPALLRGIDWGTPAVYDQTVRAADVLGLELTALPTWHDVDEPSDLAALRRRLAAASEPGEPALRRLARHLDTLLLPAPGNPGTPGNPGNPR